MKVSIAFNAVIFAKNEKNEEMEDERGKKIKKHILHFSNSCRIVFVVN